MNKKQRIKMKIKLIGCKNHKSFFYLFHYMLTLEIKSSGNLKLNLDWTLVWINMIFSLFFLVSTILYDLLVHPEFLDPSRLSNSDTRAKPSRSIPILSRKSRKKSLSQRPSSLASLFQLGHDVHSQKHMYEVWFSLMHNFAQFPMIH